MVKSVKMSIYSALTKIVFVKFLFCYKSHPNHPLLHNCYRFSKVFYTKVAFSKILVKIFSFTRIDRWVSGLAYFWCGKWHFHWTDCHFLAYWYSECFDVGPSFVFVFPLRLRQLQNMVFWTLQQYLLVTKIVDNALFLDVREVIGCKVRAVR